MGSETGGDIIYKYFLTSNGELYHYGVKGMRWGVRRSKEQLGRKKSFHRGQILPRTIISGHASTPKKSHPNSLMDHISNNGSLDVRTFYDSKGLKSKDIHLTDHGNSKHHNSIHVVMYTWNEDGSLKCKSSRDITNIERKENADIL